MPINKPTPLNAPVFYPEANYNVGKYMDLLKFVSLLQKRSLFFCRLDKLEDKFEGTTAKPNFELRKSWLREQPSPMPKMPETEIIEKISQLYDLQQKMKALKCVCCWNKMENESAALWKIYSEFNKGILIKSSIPKLHSAFEQTPQELELTEISYIDYNKDSMPDGNINFPFLHKQKAYSYEEEIRLIFSTSYGEDWTHDWSTEEVEEGVYIKCDLEDLIEEVVVSPYSPTWFFMLIKDLLVRFGLNKSVIKSELSLT
jgi:hypothetical protein